MDFGKEALGERNSTVKALDDLAERVADDGLLLELGLEVGEDGWVQQAGGRVCGHC